MNNHKDLFLHSVYIVSPGVGQQSSGRSLVKFCVVIVTVCLRLVHQSLFTLCQADGGLFIIYIKYNFT